jgi:hypothetical protein
MLSTLSIYAFGLLVCLLSGVALRMVIDFRGRWFSHWCLPLGTATAIFLLYPLGALMPMRVGAYVYCGGLASVLCTGIVLRLRGSRRGHLGGLREALRPESSDIQILTIGFLAGIALLVPLFSLGFPSTISIGIYDGWIRAAGIEVLRDHTLGFDAAGGGPLGGYSSVTPGLGAGFDDLGALIATVLGKQGVEIVTPLAAVAVPIAVSGWSRLWTVIGGDRRPSGLQALLLAAAAASPPFILLFTDTYITQFFSLAQWPFAVAAALCFFGSVSVRTLLVATVAVAGVIATYPPLLPWLVPAVAVSALFASSPAELPLVRRLSVSTMLRGWIGHVALLLGFAGCVFALAPIQVLHALNSVIGLSSGGLFGSSLVFPLWELDYYLLLLAGVRSQYDLPPAVDSVSLWTALPGALLVGAVASLGIVVLRASASRVSARLLAIGGTTLAVTLTVFVKYKYADSFSYGAYKATLSGGTLLAGLLVITLAGRTNARLWPLQLWALGGLAAIWLPTSVDLLQLQTTGRANIGFRADDLELAQEIEALPPSSEILVEGAAETTNSYRLRMTAAYYAAALERPLEGLGSTQRYGAIPGGPVWLPTRPWSYVVSSTEPLPFGANRNEIWRNDLYRISEAPPLDVTPYDLQAPCASAGSGAATTAPRQSLNWLPGQADRSGTFEPLSGPAELVISNRSPRSASARLTMKVSSYKVARRVMLSASGARPERTSIAPGPPQRMELTVPVNADSTTVVSMQIEPGCHSQSPQTPLIGVRDVRVRGLGELSAHRGAAGQPG